MPREFSAVNVAIWADPEFRCLPPAAQHLYLLLWTSPGLNYVGVHDWRPGRLAALSSGFTAEHIAMVGDCLAARYFLVIDDETEEVLVRSWARFDGLLKQPRMAVSYATTYAQVASSRLRAVLVHETKKMHDSTPELACWKDKRVTELLSHPSVSAKDLPTPDDPFGGGFGGDFGLSLALGLPQTQADVSPPVCTPPTPAPTPAPNTLLPEPEPKKSSARRLPDSWAPTDEHRKRCEAAGLDIDFQVERFKAHAEANDRRQANWNGAFTQWLLIAKPEKPTPAAERPRNLPHASQIERAPSGMTDDESRAWMAEQRRRRQHA